MTFKERANDLFVPMRRRARSASVDVSGSNDGPSTPQLVPDQYPSGTRISSGQRSASSSTTKAAFIPSTGARYSVPASSSNHDPFKFIPKTSSPLKHKTPESEPTTKSRRHSKRFSSPVYQVAEFASRIRNAMRSEKPTEPVQDLVGVDVDAELEEEQLARLAMPTPFPSPDPVTQPARFIDQHNQGSSKDSSRQTPYDLEESYHLDQIKPDSKTSGPRAVRPRSRASTHSSRDRSHPPGSFPLNFYERGLPQQESKAVPPRFLSNELYPAVLDKSHKRYTTSDIPSVATYVPEHEQKSRARPANSAHLNQLPSSTRNSMSAYTATPNSFTQHRRSVSAMVNQISRSQSQSPSRSTSSYVRSSSARARQSADLSFHSTVHCYADCLHTSPPATRPLNVQPGFVTDYAGPEVQSAPPRSVIPGSCFDCDTANRRDEETRTLLQYSPEISRLAAELDILISCLEETEFEKPALASPPRTPTHRIYGSVDLASPGQASIATRNTIDSGSTTNTVNTNMFTDATSITSESTNDSHSQFAQRIQQLERTVTELTAQRDAEVSRIWSGYSARWGPGTLGVVKTRDRDSLSSRSASRTTNRSRPVSMYAATPDALRIAPNYGHNRSVSTTQSIHSSPQRYGRSRSSTEEDDFYYNQHVSSTPKTPILSQMMSAERAGTVRQMVERYDWETPARSVSSSKSQHVRARSRDSTASSVHGARSVAGTGTGISYDTASTPIGRMKVNWIRGLDDE